MKRRRKKLYIIIGVIIVIILLVIGSVLTFRYFKKHDSNKSIENNIEAEANTNNEDNNVNDEESKIEEPPIDDGDSNITDTSNGDNVSTSNVVTIDSDEYDINIYNKIANLSVVGIGDSVMLGAVNDLQNLFNNGYFDGKVSRQIKQAIPIIEELKEQDKLGSVVVIALGSNGNCATKYKEELINTIGNREIFWVNVTNNDKVNINDSLWALANQYSNLHIIDWESASKDHWEYFYNKGIHLNVTGRKAYAKVVFDAIYNYYVTAN